VDNADNPTGPDQAETRNDLRALARMIEYVSSEAKRHGLLLTGHLLDLAGWSLEEATTDSAGPRQPPPELARPEKPN
jgi:hypothetical protein